MIYLASSWRNRRYPQVLAALQAVDTVYDFRADGEAFDWGDIDPDWQRENGEQVNEQVTVGKFKSLLQHPRAESAHNADTTALRSARAVVLCTPCGASSHLEAGLAIGCGIPLLILTESTLRPELTYRDAVLITDQLHKIVSWLYVSARSLSPR